MRRNSRVVSHRVGGDQAAVLLHLDTSAYHSVNEVGAIIWDLIANPISIAELHTQLAAKFADVPDSLDTDLHEFLDDLVGRGLIEVERSAPGAST